MLVSVLPLSAFAAETDEAVTAAAEDIAAVSADEELADTGADADVAPEAADADLADTGAVISTVNVNVTSPSAGYKPVYSATTSDTTYTLGNVYWYESTDNSNFTQWNSSDTNYFRAGRYYRVWVFVTAKSGYTLSASSNTASTVTAKINGFTATKITATNYTADQGIWVYYTFGPLYDSGIKSISASISFPYPGTSPSYSGSVSTTGIQMTDYTTSSYKNGVYWHDDTAGSDVSVSNTSYKFIEGHKYTVKLDVEPKDGYSIYKTTSSVTGYVNANKGTVEVWSTGTNSDRNVKVCFTFTSAYNTTATIAVSGVTAPTTGGTPSYTQPSESSAAFNIATGFTSTYWKNGVAWFDVTDNSYLPTDGSTKFKAGHQYRVYVAVAANTGAYWRFASTISTATINGNNGTVWQLSSTSPYNDSTLYRAVSYTYTALSYLSCSTITVTNVPTAASAGSAPSYSAPTVAATGCRLHSSYTSGSYKNGVAWYDVTTGQFVSTSGYTFIAGHDYRVYYVVVTSDNYAFSSSVSATVNGSSSAVGTLSGLNSSYYRTVRSANIPATGTVYSVSVSGIDAPIVGNTPDYTATAGSTTYYSVENYTSGTTWKNGLIWYNVTDSSTMATTDKFEAGKQYRVSVSLVPATGYTFAAGSSMSATLNSKTASITTYTAGTNIGVQYTFTATTQLTSVAVTNVTAPKAGVAPSFAAPTVASGAQYSVYTGLNNSLWKDGVQWYDSTAGSTVPNSDSTYKFISGHQYNYKVILKVGTNAAFKSASIGGTVNGSTGSTNALGGYAETQYLVLSYTFTAPTGISYVTVTGVTAPVAGQKPAYTFTLPTGANYESDNDSSNTNWSNGVCWYDESGSSISSDTSFVAGKKYTVRIGLNAKSGYNFYPAASMSGTVNSNTATIVDYGTLHTHIGVGYTFTAASVTTINSVEVTDVTAPVPGAKPAYTATAPSGKGYQIETTWDNGSSVKNGMTWYNVTDDVTMNSTDTFVSGKQYRVRVSLINTAATYEFAGSSTSATLNGHTAEIHVWGTGKTNIGVDYTYTCRNKTTVSSVDIRVNPPRPGEKPSFVATIPSGFGYAVDTERGSTTFYKNGVEWDHGDKYISPSSTTYTFVSGEKYTVTILLKPSDEYYQFASTATGTVNGNTGTVKVSASDSSLRYITYEFTCSAATLISAVEADIDAPLPGATPSYTATLPSGKGYKLQSFTSGTWKNGIQWLQGSNPISTTAAFENGKTYTVKMVLNPTSNAYEFKKSGMTAKIDSETASITYTSTNQQIYVSYTFTCGNPVQLVYFEATIPAPVAGQPLSYSATVPSGQGYKVEEYDSTNFKNGVRWSVSGSYISVGSNTKAEAGKTYTVEISLVPTSNQYTFKDSGMSGKVNGETADAGKYATNNNYLKYNFTVSDTPVTDVTVNVTSYLDATEDVTVELVQDGITKYTKSVKGTISSAAAVSFDGVVSGTYTIRVSKKNHVTREYNNVNISGTTYSYTTKICPKGDANLNGSVQANDAMLAYRSSTNTYTFTDDYAKKCADANGNGYVQANDAMMIYRQSTGKHTLF